MLEADHRIAPRQRADPDIEAISDAELAAGLLTVAQALLGATREELIRNTREQLGFRRTSPNIEAVLANVIGRLVQDGRLTEVGESLYAQA